MSSSPSRQVPFFRLLIPFIAGILTIILFGKLLNSYILQTVLITLLALSFLTLLIQTKWHQRWLVGLIFYIFLYSSGASITCNYIKESKIKTEIDSDALIVLLEPPEQKASTIKVLAKVEALIEEGVWVPVNEKVILYFRSADSTAIDLEYGSRLAARTTFSTPPDPKNPFEFNFKKYLSRKQVYRISFIPEGNWTKLGQVEGGIFSFAYNLRDRLLSTFIDGGINNQNLAVVSALTMGYKSLLDDEIRKVYSASGAMHILAVSGLHVGILFLIVSGVLFFLDKIRNGKRLKAIILILFLWFFAVFTGLSPSVLRASLMFSLVIGGIALSRRTNIYNTLSGSAFILLCFNPMLISDIGFQLSYLAVISIVFFYPYIYKLVFVKNKWADKVWSLIAVSVAAQIGTFAIGLHYFQQFPNYFLLTNLFAIPLATIILYLAVGVILFSPIPMAIKLIGLLLDKTLSLLNYLVSFTESLPYSTTTGLGISSSQTIFLILAIILLALFLEKRKVIIFVGMMGCLLLFFAENSYIRFNQINQSEIIVFSTKGSSTIGFTEGKRITFATTDTTNQNPWEKYSFNIQGYINNTGVKVNQKTIKIGSLIDDHSVSSNLTGFTNEYGTWLNFADKSVYIPTGEKIWNATTSDIMDVDLLILTNYSRTGIENILNIFNPRLVVIDCSVPKWQVEKIQILLDLNGIRTFNVEKEGALRIEV